MKDVNIIEPNSHLQLDKIDVTFQCLYSTLNTLRYANYRRRTIIWRGKITEHFIDCRYIILYI